MSEAIVIVVIVSATTLAVVGFGVGIYNRLIRSQVQTREAWSGIDVQLRRRTSLAPNLVESVRGYAVHERSVFDEVTRARNGLENAKGASESTGANRELTTALSHLFAVVENYPELRASSNFQDLNARLTDIEEKIAYARQFYNRNVADFNVRIRSIPDVLIARLLGMERFEFFEAEEGTRGDIHASFTTPVEGEAPDSPAERE